MTSAADTELPSYSKSSGVNDVTPISMEFKLKCFIAALLAASCLVDWSAVVAADAAAQNPGLSVPPASSGHQLTEGDAQVWLDGLMPTALNTARVPGAVVVIVKDGQVLLAKGYGFSDFEKGIPVDPRTTLFRPGSTSKLFTWTAVMQLVEQGKLDLDADVNRYIDFKIPQRDGLPVTLREIMTHRAGFEETVRDLLSFGDTSPALADVVKRYVPPRIWDPSEGPGYSNYATALAGYIVQRVSGQAYEEYIQQHILTPLDMRNSTFRQPLPPDMSRHMSKGYETRDDPGAGYEIVSMPPAGALASTGEDMGHFMIAHLQLGRYNDSQILEPETARVMQTTITKALPDLNGNALGFYEQNINGHRVIAHGGDTNYFHTDLILFPDDHVGLFISVNAKGKEGLGEFLRQSVFEEFSDRYFPGVSSTTRVDAATAKAHAAMIAGAYINTRRADSTFVSLINLIATSAVKANANGTITAAPVGQMETFVEVEPFLWQQLGGHDRIQAIAKDGRVVRWSSDIAAPIFIYERAGGIAGSGLELPLAGGSLVLLALTAIMWPVVALVRRHYQRTFIYTGHRALAYRLVRICAVFAVAAIGLWAGVVADVTATNGVGVELILHTAQLVSFIAFAGGLAIAFWNLILALKSGGWADKSFATALTAAFAVMFWISLSYHLIGISGEY
jgi:CubicO group peptidase (beta-lactamase class C family)